MVPLQLRPVKHEHNNASGRVAAIDSESYRRHPFVLEFNARNSGFGESRLPLFCVPEKNWWL